MAFNGKCKHVEQSVSLKWHIRFLLNNAEKYLHCLYREIPYVMKKAVNYYKACQMNVIQVDVVLPLKTRHPAAITELITHALMLHTMHYENALNFAL